MLSMLGFQTAPIPFSRKGQSEVQKVNEHYVFVVTSLTYCCSLHSTRLCHSCQGARRLSPSSGSRRTDRRTTCFRARAPTLLSPNGHLLDMRIIPPHRSPREIRNLTRVPDPTRGHLRQLSKLLPLAIVVPPKAPPQAVPSRYTQTSPFPTLSSMNARRPTPMP